MKKVKKKSACLGRASSENKKQPVSSAPWGSFLYGLNKIKKQNKNNKLRFVKNASVFMDSLSKKCAGHDREGENMVRVA